jgi:cell division initiation protein
MALTPLDIHHKEFKTARFGGYNEEDVDSFLDLVADEFERLLQESGDLKQQMEHMKKRLSEFEEMQTSLQSALLAASKSAEAVKEQARQESEATLSKAQEESDSLMRSAQEQARQTMLAAQNDRQKIERAISKLQEVKKRYLLTIKDMAEAHLAQVGEWESRDEAEGIVVEPTPAVEQLTQAVKPPPSIKEEAAVPQPVQPPVVGEAPDPAPASPAAPAAVERQTSVEETPMPAEVQAPAAAPPPGPPVERPGSPEAPVAREMREVAPPQRQPEARQQAQGAGPEEKVAPPSSNLVDEVLAMDSADESIFGELEDDPEGDTDKGKKGRKEKRDKHFFWE